MAGAGLTQAPYGATSDGSAVEVFTLRSADVAVRILTFGALIAAIEAPDRNGIERNVVLGCADFAGYVADTAYFGATIGRFANRIARGCFMLDGTEYRPEG